MPAIFINHYPSPFSNLSSTLKNLSVFSFLLMKTNPHLLLFLPTLPQHFFQLCCISFDIQDQICLQHSRCTQTMKDYSGILILLFAPHSIHNNFSTVFAFLKAISIELLFSHKSSNHEALLSGNSQLVAHYNI